MLGIIWHLSLTLGEVVHIYYLYFVYYHSFLYYLLIDMATGGGSLND